MARLPVIGGDEDYWGNVLVEFLQVEHDSDGTLKRLNQANGICPLDSNSLVPSANLGLKGGYSAIVYIDGSSVIARDYKGDLIASGTAGVNDASVIQAALDSQGTVLLMGGTLTLTTTLVLKSNTQLIGNGIGITKLKLADGVDKDMIQTYAEANSLDTQYDENIVIANMEIDGNGSNQTTGMGLNIENITRSKLLNLYIHDTYGKAIRINTVGTKDRLVLNDIQIVNILLDTNYSAVDLASISAINQLQISNFIVKNSQGSGLTTGSLTNGSYANIVAVNNAAYGFSIEGWGELHDISATNIIAVGNNHGIVIENNGTSPYNIFITGVVSENSGDGLRIYNAQKVFAKVCAYRNGWRGVFVASGSKYCKIKIVAIENGQAEDGRQYGAMINDASSDWNVIDVLGIDTQTTPTQLYAACIGSSGPPANNHVIVDGYGNSDGLYLDNGTNTKITGPERSGSATIANGNTSVTVNHGLASAPTNIQLTGTHSEVKDAYVTNVGSTSFDIKVDSAVTADRTVYWKAKV